MSRPKWLTTGEVADLTGQHVTSVRRHCRNGLVDGADHTGRDWMIPATSRYIIDYTPYQALRKRGADQPAGAQLTPSAEVEGKGTT